MQTLINTYPDSEYLAKAKLAIADSYYKEGGTSNLALAISGYKDFEVFFPFLPEATYAQMQVAMGHYKQMEKPDRDRTHAREAEAEFQTFLQKYPNDPLAPQAQQHLREVQEVLAEGDYRIGYYYYVKGDKRAAATRLISVTSRYPLYSKSDQALWMMADIFEKSEHKDIATGYYARIVKNYPLSSMVPDAKNKLKAFGAPIPQPDPAAVAWMTAEQYAPRPKTPLYKKPMDLLHNGPGNEIKLAARNGAPTLTPETDSFSAGDILKPGGTTNLGVGSGLVATVQAGGVASSTGTADTVAPAGTDGATTPPVTTEQPNVPATTPAAAATDDPAKTPVPSTESSSKPDVTPASTDAAAGTDTAKSDATSADAAKAGDAASADPKKESSSKKKKGLRKIVPW